MRVIVYDCTDRPDLGYKSPTLRIVDENGSLVLQGIVLSRDGRQLAEKIAAGLGVPCEWIGPPASIAKPVETPAAAEPSVTKPKRSGLLFMLEE